MSSKACFKCGVVKPLSAFYRQSTTRDGHLNKCIECTKADVTANRRLRADYYREYDRQRANQPDRVVARSAYAKTEAWRRSHKTAMEKWSTGNPERVKAKIATSNAIRDGRLTPQPCFVCGEKAQAHHADYSAPLAVTWLCACHHAQLHAEHRSWLRLAA